MPKARKARKSTAKRYKPYTKRGKPSKKLVATIKKVVNTQVAETKTVRGYGVNVGTIAVPSKSGLWYGMAPLRQIPQGDSDFARIGDKIYLKGFSIFFRVHRISPPDYTYGAYPMRVRFMVYKKPLDGTTLASTSPNSFTTGTIGPAIKGGDPLGVYEEVDKEKNIVVKSVVRTARTQIFGATTATYACAPEIVHRMWIPVNKTIQFNGDESGSTKGWNWYIGFKFDGDSANETSVLNNFGGYMDLKIYYTDC